MPFIHSRDNLTNLLRFNNVIPIRQIQRRSKNLTDQFKRLENWLISKNIKVTGLVCKNMPRNLTNKHVVTS